MDKIVTRESLQAMLDSEDTSFVDQVIGKALVAIFNRQTASEKYSDSTSDENGIGFTGFDAHSGSISAKYYIKRKSFMDWQREMWLKKGKTGFSRIAKYHKQLNEVANEKKAEAEKAKQGLTYD